MTLFLAINIMHEVIQLAVPDRKRAITSLPEK
jgi:hypothetical protein